MRCTISRPLARRLFVDDYHSAVRGIFYGDWPVPSIAWVAHMIGLAATFDWALRERVREGLMFAVQCRRKPVVVQAVGLDVCEDRLEVELPEVTCQA